MRQDNKVPALEVEAMKAVKMQIVSWHTCDYDYNADDDVNDDDANECEDGRYLIKMFGVTEEGQSVSVNVLNFTPFFFIKVVDSKKCNRLFLESLREQLVNELPFHLKASLIGVKFMRKKDFWGFHNGETFNFVRITFKSIKCYRAAIRIVQRGIRVLRFDYSKFKYPLYESNIDPFLRFIHLRDIEPAGWVSIHEYDVNSQLMPSKCQIDINAHWLKVNPCQAERMAPLVVASFDIECVSSHGDFPVARKDYKKLAYELFQLYESKKDSRDDLQEYLYDELVKVFDHEREGVLSKVFLKHELSREEVLKLRDKTKRYMEDIVNVASGKLVYRGVTSGANNGKSQGPTKDEIIKKLTSMFGYYGECDSKQLQTPEFMHAKVIDTMTNGIGADRIIYWKGMYPMLEGDPIIQIGTTVHKYGEKECSYKHILSVGTCDDIEGVVVESCETEQELLERWCDLVNRLDPDIMTGYNIYGFDMSYMYERSIELGMKSKFCRIGRLKNHESLFQEKTLSSSALGDNILKFVDMEGRVLIDVMKVVQRDHKLDSYKLDAVASHFMKMNKHDVSPNDIFRLSRGSSADRAIVANYCFVEGTRVSLPGCSVDIRCLEHLNTDVITWVENKGFATSQKVKFFNNGKQNCLELTLIDGSKIKCTNNHKFLTKDGWIEAEHLRPIDKILCYPEPAFVDYEKEKLFTFTFSKLIGTLDYNKSCILMRILGYLITDGGISEDTCYKTYSSGRTKYTYDRGYINLGTMIDALNMQKDIMMLFGKSPAINRQKYTYRITLPTKLTKWLLSIDGVQKGKRLSSNATLPALIMDDDCPTWILREFLKGLMGGDGYCPCFEKNTNKFSGVSFGQSKTYENIDSLINFMNHIKRIFEKFDLRSSLSSVQKNVKGEGYTVKVNIVHDDTIAFYEKIGYAYCIGKSYKLAVASSYYKLKTETRRQCNWVCERVKQLKDDMTIVEAIKQAHSELKSIEPIFNEHYSLPTKKMLNLKEAHVSTCDLKNCNFKQCHFPSIEEYLKLTESYDRFITDDNTKSHAVKHDATYSPCYYLSILNKKNIGEHDVYDIEVKDTHNFVANGTVVHNCVQDCALCNHLMMKLEILANNVGMANVCSVPLSFIFMRGQGVKIFSLVAKQCKEDNFLIPALNKGKLDDDAPEDEDGYEGAIVLEPKTGIYTEDPISVLDYASLYPSSMISENLSHDCYVEIGGRYDNLPGIEYLDIKYDIYEKIDEKKVRAGEKVCRFVQNEKGAIPRILMKLIRQRKETRKKIEYKTVIDVDGNKHIGLLSEDDEKYTLTTIDGKKSVCLKSIVYGIEDTYNDFMKAVLDGLQSAYKVTANSLYGQIGARTSPIYLKDIAACTTATGRNMILKAKKFLEDEYVGVNIVYGDTDSLFVSFPMKFTDNDGVLRKRTGADAVKHAIDMGVDASSKFKKFLKPPHDLEMEKVFYPFILISKKRYCAMKYESDPTKGKFSSMGVALKRRDNAPIVKKVYGGVIDIIMKEQDISKSIGFLQQSMGDLIDGKYPLEDLIISKSLRADYKDPTRIAHKALAERMGERDPGNKPQVNDRIPYVYVDISERTKGKGKKEKVLQGDRIEHPEHIRKNNLKPDYEFYITNQIMKPVSQIYALVLEQVPGYKKSRAHYHDVEKKLLVEKEGDIKKVRDKIADMKEADVQDILFRPFLMKLENKRCGNRPITDFFALRG
jgi:DNA polymerase elongation subunit (family B)/intein/homing endonuclease